MKAIYIGWAKAPCIVSIHRVRAAWHPPLALLGQAGVSFSSLAAGHKLQSHSVLVLFAPLPPPHVLVPAESLPRSPCRISALLSQHTVARILWDGASVA